MINVVLVEPEIPQNTGNIARTCACTGSRLHLIRPFKFEISDRTLKRAGLDYWDKVEVLYYDNLDDFFAKNAGGKFFYCSTKAKRTYTEVELPDNCFLLFGKETKGLPEHLIFDNPETAIRIPMGESLRSLNLANSVAIVLYDALRRLDFPGLR